MVDDTRGIEIWAKSKPTETLKEHTENCLKSLADLRQQCRKRLEACLTDNTKEIFWEFLRLATFFHDFGKANTYFQSAIRKKIGEPPLPFAEPPLKIPHNYLSPFFMAEIIEDIEKKYDRKFYDALLKTIAFSHFREIPPFNFSDIKELKEDLKRWLPILQEKFKDYGYVIRTEGLHYLNRLKTKLIIYAPKLDQFDILLKGLLLRIDHSASAKLPIEKGLPNKREMVYDYLKNKNWQWQIELFNKLNTAKGQKNGILTASTGIGKTEFALLWSQDKKLFYTLPVRTSVNSMWVRFKKLFNEENVGLLHSDALSFLIKEKEEDDLPLHQYLLAKQLSLPIIVSTADQLFAATLKYPGFEKIYSTLAYSCVIIDEVQAYSPHTAAIITHGLKEIVELGGRFLVITATLPPIIKEAIEKNTALFIEKKLLPVKKHKIEKREGDIKDISSDQLRHLNAGSPKILIVCNTVEKAKEVYKSINITNLKKILLHSRFTLLDRMSKESEVLAKNFVGLLVSTQIVEVSLDIDFDLLITELAPMDVLIQRMGRIKRKLREGDYSPKQPNIIIALNPSDQGKIYEGGLQKKTKDLIKDGVIDEATKSEYVEELYAKKNLKGSKFLHEFQRALDRVKNYSVRDKDTAYKIFREIEYQIRVIPASFLTKPLKTLYKKNEQLLKKIISPLKISEEDCLETAISKVAKNPIDPARIWTAELIKYLELPLPYSKELNVYPLSECLPDKARPFFQGIMVAKINYDDELGAEVDPTINSVTIL